MKIRYFIFVLIFTIIIILFADETKKKEVKNTNTIHNNKLNRILENEGQKNDEEVVISNNNILKLYSKAACVYDCNGKRVLYNLNSQVKLPMASTTKIMTCILALESNFLEMDVVFSKYAASMPNVQLHALEGDKFKLKDILYSLMLESHNDSAVAIAENIAAKMYNVNIDIDDLEKSKLLVEKFSVLMNKKAKEIGAKNTNFVTPNGLDADKHYTTAKDLALIGAYAIKNRNFLDITNEKSYDLISNEGKHYSLNNKNKFLSMYKGAIGCKTGYTSKAGYCFVGGVKKDNYNLISVVLASGWPPNKDYKWADTKKLMDYAINNYKDSLLYINNKILNIKDINIIGGTKKKVNINIDEKINILLSNKDKIKYKVILPQKLSAPIKENEIVGLCKVYLNNELYKIYTIKTIDSVNIIDYRWNLENICEQFCFFRELHI